MKLRDYQQSAVTAIEDHQAKEPNSLIVMATGTGKTVVFCELIQRRRALGRALVLCHRMEILEQTARHLRHTYDTMCDFEVAERSAHREWFKSPVVLSTIQTQISGNGNRRRMQGFDPQEFATVIVDEAHHAPAKTYRHTIEYYQSNGETRIIGATATPDRVDEKSLGAVLGECVYEYDIERAKNDGWLVPIAQYYEVIDELDVSFCKRGRKDLSRSDLERAVEPLKVVKAFASRILELAGRNRTLIFTVSVKQAQDLADELNDAVPASAFVITGKTPMSERLSLIADFRCKKFLYFVNVDVAVEGFDIAEIDYIVMARPTGSRARYCQQIGRGTRTSCAGGIDRYHTAEERRAAIAESEKPHLTVIDFVGNSGRHKLITAIDVFAGSYDDRIVELANQFSKEQNGRVSVDDAIEHAKITREEERANEFRRSFEVKATFKRRLVDPFDVFDLQPRRQAGWDSRRQASEAQVKLLGKFRVDVRDGLSLKRASQLIDECIRRRKQSLCTYRQAKKLQSFGYETIGLKFGHASELLDRLARNGWRRV